MVTHIMEVRNTHHKSNDVHRTLKNEQHDTWGSLVASIMRLNWNPDGTLNEGWEKEFLCSNPQVHAPEGPEEGPEEDTPEGQSRVPAASPGASPQGLGIVPVSFPYLGPILPEADENNMADALVYIQHGRNQDVQ